MSGLVCVVCVVCVSCVSYVVAGDLPCAVTDEPILTLKRSVFLTLKEETRCVCVERGGDTCVCLSNHCVYYNSSLCRSKMRKLFNSSTMRQAAGGIAFSASYFPMHSFTDNSQIRLPGNKGTGLLIIRCSVPL